MRGKEDIILMEYIPPTELAETAHMASLIYLRLGTNIALRGQCDLFEIKYKYSNTWPVRFN